MIRKLVVISIVCLTISGYFLATAGAQTTHVQSRGVQSKHVQPKYVQPDIAGLVAEVVAQGIAAEGYEVQLDGTSVMVATQHGELILDLPATREALERGDVMASLDGKVVMPGPLEVGGPVDLVQCLLTALDVYFLQLNICDLAPGSEILCITEATFELAVNSLRCVGD